MHCATRSPQQCTVRWPGYGALWLWESRLQFGDRKLQR